MAHDKVYGFCENKCKVEVPSKAEILEEIANSAKIEAGSYTGTGGYGESNKNSLTLPFSPKIMFVSHAGTRDYSNSGVIMIYTNITAPKATSISLNSYTGDTTYICNVYAEISGKTITWHSNVESRQMNEAGKVYDYIAFK